MMASSETNTIFALSSGRGRAGVAVIRISGVRAREAVEALAGAAPEPRQAALRRLSDPHTDELLDEALVLLFAAPASFTGEDVAELHVHGGPAVLEGVISALGRMDGLRGAEPGEFARRAFANHKLDLTQAEGLADLIEAETEAQRRQALRQSGGDLRGLCEQWRENIIHAASLVEAALDFSDEADVPALVEGQARPVVEALLASLIRHLDDALKGERLREGLKVVLAGAPNAGKSSLLNALSRRDAAIVSGEPGTTRDVIEVHLNLGGYPVTLSDTAGLRAASGEVEREGVKRTIERAGKADLILWLIDGNDPEWEPPEDLKVEQHTLIPVFNKADLAQPDTAHSGALCISAKTGKGLDSLIEQLAARAADMMAAGEPAVVTRARQRIELEACRDALGAFLNGAPEQLELRAEDLRVAARALGRVTGSVDVEDVLDRIFGDFCIGK
ncbi:MAG: tRNA uridine-5-carboxymethylaminomethyl(34) synthesis GTPase MnmE [Methyloligellaceae bacterium]